MVVAIDPNLCVCCGSCVNICPSCAITLKNKKATIDVDKCTGCKLCLEICNAHISKEEVLTSSSSVIDV